MHVRAAIVRCLLRRLVMDATGVAALSWIACSASAQEVKELVEKPRPMQVVCEATLAAELTGKLPAGCELANLDELDAASLVARTAAGESFVWIGPPQKIPAKLWIGHYRPSEAALKVVVVPRGPLVHEALPPIEATVWGAYIHPPEKMPKHNIAEEPRAEFLPLLEAVDRFGEPVAYPGVLFEHTTGSLAMNRFAGSRGYYFLFDTPAAAMDSAAWVKLLGAIADKEDSRLHVRYCRPNYASYHPSERAQLEVRVRNSRPSAAAFEVKFSVRQPGAAAYETITKLRRVVPAQDDTEVACEYLVPQKAGVYHVMVEVLQDYQETEQLAELGKPELVEQRATAFVVAPKPLQTPRLMDVAGPNFTFGDEELFCVGTHYYPSSSWWEWAWKDFPIELAERDLRAIRENGNRIVRVWVDPVLDEKVLRAMDAAIYLAAEQGIVLDVCIFTQWTRDIGFERPSGEQVTFNFRHPDDFNLYSISLRNLNLQREYVDVLAKRWKDAGNVVYNLANESYVNDPDAEQMDAEAEAWPDVPKTTGELRDTLLYRNWAAAVSEPIRAAGGNQLIFGGYIFSLDQGGDNYLANADAPLMPWHCYMPPRSIGTTVQYFDAAGSGRPLLLEEFGTASDEPATHYDLAAHYALAGGAAAAMSYEWGVSRLCQESSYEPTPLRDANVPNPDPRWFKPVINYGKTEAMTNGVGLAPFPSGFAYGSIYHGTPFPAPPAVNLGRVGVMAGRLARKSPPEQVIVLVPQAQTNKAAAYFTLFEQLWKEGVEFGVCQEVNLAKLPEEARTVIAPGEFSAESEAKLAKLQDAGVQVFRGASDEWRQAKVLPRATVAPAGAAEVVIRRTIDGTLYALFPLGEAERAVLTAGGHKVAIGLKTAGFVHTTVGGVDLIEATGDVEIDGTPFAKIDSCRGIIAAEGSRDLMKAKQISLMATAPGKIRFMGRTIVAVEAYVESRSDPVGNVAIVDGSDTLEIDRDLARYRLAVRFAE
jgi:hypothetical protein